MADTAVDGQRLSDQSNETQGAFMGAYGGDAAQEWIRQHNNAIGFSGSPDDQYATAGGVKTITQIGVELRNANYGGPWDRGSMLGAYGRASGQTPASYSPPVARAPTSPQAANPTDLSHLTPTTTGGTFTGGTLTSSGTPVQVTGNFGAWLSQSTRVLGVELPNTLLIAVPIALGGAMLLQQRPVGRR